MYLPDTSFPQFAANNLVFPSVKFVISLWEHVLTCSSVFSLDSGVSFRKFFLENLFLFVLCLFCRLSRFFKNRWKFLEFLNLLLDFCKACWLALMLFVLKMTLFLRRSSGSFGTFFGKIRQMWGYYWCNAIPPCLI